MAMLPIPGSRPSPHGSFDFMRERPGEGQCRKGYPCIHRGVDLVAPAGALVYAPEDGVITDVSHGDYPPWSGYGPGVAVLKGNSGAYHVLAHLTPDVTQTWRPGAALREGQAVGRVSGARHVHWEVRHQRTGPRATNTVDPLGWLARWRRNPLYRRIVELFR